MHQRAGFAGVLLLSIGLAGCGSHGEPSGQAGTNAPTIPPAPLASAPPASAPPPTAPVGLIANTKPTAYSWDTLAVGKKVYVDAAPEFTAVPGQYRSLSYLQTADAEKFGNAADTIVFDVSQKVAVLVALDRRAGAHVPAWLASWTDTADTLVSTTTSYRVYRKSYDAGTVTLGGNEVGFAMYSVAVDDGTGQGNTSPVIGGSPSTGVSRGSNYSFTPTAGDVDGDSLTFSIANKPVWATFSTSTGRLSGTPGASHVGAYANIVISVSDGQLATSLPPFSITVNAVNAPPTITGTPAATANQGSPYSFTPSANDPDGNPLTFAIANKPVWAAFSTSTGHLSGTPSASHVGTSSNIVISVSDGQATTSLPPFSITVNAVNVPPTISGTPATAVNQGSPYSFTPGANDPDGNPLTFSIANRPVWAAFDARTGQLSGTPGASHVGAYANIVISVSDGQVATSLAPFSITVNAVNAPPTITGTPTATVNQGSPYSFTPGANDPDGNPLTFSIANKPVWATFSTSTGQLSGTPNASHVGTSSNIVISVSDGQVATSLAPFSITVNAVNAPPTITGTPAATVNQGSPYLFTPSANDTDGNPLTFSIANKPVWAAFSTSTGQLSGTPSASHVGTSSNIVISVSDGQVATSLAPFSITVNAVNAPPTITGTPAATVNQGSPYLFTPSANDTDGNPLTFSIANKPVWAAFSTSTGQLSGTPNASHVGTSSNIVISVSDGQVATSLAPFSITVNAVNAPPTIAGTPATTANQDAPYSFTPTANDPDGGPLTFSIVNKPVWAAFNTSTGQLSGTPNASHVGTYASVAISVSDGQLTTSLPPFTITVSAAVNAPPTITGAPPTTVDQGALYLFTPSASDPDNGSLTFAIANKPVWATFSTSTGQLTGTPGGSHVGAYANIVISVSDGQASASLPPFSISVNSINAPPTITGTPATTVNRDSPYSFTPSANDPDGDPLTFAIANKPVWAAFNTSTGQLSGTPTAGHVGTYSNIVISVSDGQVATSLAPFSITVNAINAPPTITGTPATTVNRDAPYSFTPSAGDVDGDPLTFSIANKPVWATFSTSTGQLSGTPAGSHVGTYANIVISVSDSQLATSLPPFSITVNAVNAPPTITGTPATTVNRDSPYSFTPSANDPDGNPLTFSIANKPVWATFSTSTGQLSGTPGASHVGSYANIVISVSDGQVATSLPPFAITVNAVNAPPTIVGTPATAVNQGSPYSFTPSANDPDGNPLTFSIANRPVWAAFDASTGQLSGTPGASHVGTYADIVISVSDGQVATSLPPFSITVNAVNAPPTISGTPATTVNQGSPYSFTPSANDVDGDSLTFAIANKPAWATFSTSTGQLSGTPAGSHVGTYANIVISVSDGQVATSLAPFSITVNAVNVPPTISGTPATAVNQGSPYSFTPGANDPDGNPLTFSIANRPVWAAFDASTGQLSGTPGGSHVGSYANIVISVSDGQATVSLASFSIVVVSTATGSVTLMWTPPNANKDGSPLSNLAGYTFYWGTSPGHYTNAVAENNPGLSSYFIGELTPGTWYFVVTAVNSLGEESDPSNEAQKTVP